MRIHHTAQGNHAHFGGAAADIHHHRAGGFFNRQTCTDSGGHRLFNQINGRSACSQGGIADGFALNLGGAAGHADNDARRGGKAAVIYFFDKLLEHFFGNVKVGNHAVFHRADGLNAARRAAEHFFGFGAHGQNHAFAVRSIGLHGHHRGFVQNNAFAFNVNQGIGSAQIDGQVVGKIAGQKAKHEHFLQILKIEKSIGTAFLAAFVAQKR